MKHLQVGHLNGRSCVLELTTWETSRSTQLQSTTVSNIEIGSPVTEPTGSSDYRDYGIPVGEGRWNRVWFPPNEVRDIHFTNTIDSITIVSGEISIVLDDGEHLLEQGDSVLILGVDHGWKVGPQGCTTSNILFGLAGLPVHLIAEDR